MASSVYAFLLVVLVLTELASAETSTTAPGTDPNNMLPGNQPDAIKQGNPTSSEAIGKSQTIAESQTRQEQEANRSLTLTQVFEMLNLAFVNIGGLYNTTLATLVTAVDRLVQLPPWQTVDKESEALTNIAMTFDSIFTSLPFYLPRARSGRTLHYKLAAGGALMFKPSPKTFDPLPGHQVYSDEELQVTSTFQTRDQLLGYLVYPMNACPMKPLPASEFSMISWRCVSTFRPWGYGEVIDGLVSKLIVHWTPAPRSPMVKHKCGHWNASDWEWDMKISCIVVESMGVPRNVSCSCFVEPNGDDRTDTFIVYSYEEDTVSTVHVDQRVMSTVLAETGDNSELNKVKKSLQEISVSDEYNATVFGEYLLQLSGAMHFGNTDLVNAFDDEIINDIGTVLDGVKPKVGTSTLGYRNDDLASFVIDLESYQLDAPIAFGVYTNFKYSIEIYRLTQDIAYLYSELFSEPIVYSLLFSESVIVQNSRFAFILYPPDKFFKPAAVIDGHQVASMRVLDVVLSPKGQTTQDQFVHLFSGKLTDTNLLVGCAYWSPSLRAWSTSDCFPNADLHDGVCTCNMTANFVESPTRGQYIVFNYATATFVPRRPVDPDAAEIQFLAEVAIQIMHVLLVQNIRSFEPTHALDLLSCAIKNYRLRGNLERQVASESIKAILKKPSTSVLRNIYSSKKFIGGRIEVPGWNTSITCVEPGNKCREISHSDFSDTRKLTSGKLAYAFRASFADDSNLDVMAFIVYPPRVTLHPVNRLVDHTVDNFRIVHVAVQIQVGEVYLEIYIKRSTIYNIRCATWNDELQKWTQFGCEIVNVNSVDFCNCSVPTILGGQFMVYSYSTAILDDRAVEFIGGESVTNASFILEQRAAFIKSASQMLSGSNANLASKIMRVYHKILLSVADVPQEKMQNILDDVEQAFDMFYADPTVPVTFIYDIPTSSSVKNSEVATEMFTNAVLSSGAVGSEHTESSDFAMAVIGHLHGSADTMVHGLQFSRKTSSKAFFYPSNNTAEVLKDNPSFACFVTCSALLAKKRFIFAVYPLNLSPYPYTMTNLSMFNSRQVDIYVDGDKGLKPWSKEQPTCQSSIQVYFQPTEKPKTYVKIGCATWDKAASKWTEDLCTLDFLDRYGTVSCRCNITGYRVSRIIAYEYTDLVNFSLVNLYDGPSVLFVAASAFSLLGFILIVTTAILFPTWREELSNKVIMHLALSSFVYLCMTMFRETHLIYADMKRLDLTLVAFTAFVHYTRLVHHFWGLVMSVLQYKKFSSVVGASATSHLLLKISLLAWGLPMAPIIVLLSWNLRAHFCSPDSLTHYMLYLVPVLVITLLNFGFLVQIIRNMTNGCGLWNDKELQKHGGSSWDVLKRQLKQTVMMFFLFGIPTVFEMFNDIASHSVALDYIDKMLNPIQGFVMFLFFVIMNDKTRGLWIIRVFGDALPDAKQAVKKIPFKPKVPKVAKVVEKRATTTVAIHTTAEEAKEPEPDMRTIASNALKYVETPTKEDLCVESGNELEDFNRHAQQSGNEITAIDNQLTI